MFHVDFFDHNQGRATRKIIRSDQLRISSILLYLIITVSIVYPHAWYAALPLIPILILIRISGMSWKYIGLRVLFIIPFGLVTALLMPTELGKVLIVILKMFTANLCVTFLLGTTPVSDLLKGFRSLRIPGPIVDMIGFTLRYISVLSEEAQSMIIAQRARGMQTGSFASIRTYKRAGQLLGVLLLRSLERSTRIHQAMLSRGYTVNQPQPAKEVSHERHRNGKRVLPVSGFDRSSV